MAPMLNALTKVLKKIGSTTFIQSAEPKNAIEFYQACILTCVYGMENYYHI